MQKVSLEAAIESREENLRWTKSETDRLPSVHRFRARSGANAWIAPALAMLRLQNAQSHAAHFGPTGLAGTHSAVKTVRKIRRVLTARLHRVVG